MMENRGDNGNILFVSCLRFRKVVVSPVALRVCRRTCCHRLFVTISVSLRLGYDELRLAVSNIRTPPGMPLYTFHISILNTGVSNWWHRFTPYNCTSLQIN